MKERVEEEINVILKEEGYTGEATTDLVFKHRTAAAKRVFDSLGVDDKAIILKKIEEGCDVVPTYIKQQ
jgi:hypothetical protein